MRTARDILPHAAASRLADYKRAVEHALSGMEKLILFGSRARGPAREDSDHDVAIIVRNLSDRRHVRRVLSDLAYDHRRLFHSADPTAARLSRSAKAATNRIGGRHHS